MIKGDVTDGYSYNLLWLAIEEAAEVLMHDM